MSRGFYRHVVEVESDYCEGLTCGKSNGGICYCEDGWDTDDEGDMMMDDDDSGSTVAIAITL